ncbi:Cupredoxin [Cokeromyces recurvatus]|uniref:Cupredoxin n=1 Tax=Cokeromyces recurvatus TaxID=90255 RepID=UPI00221F4BDA|nr:Cupredoxin [Cokeromyces recurvatus]KAI7904666.1 Cupredoxin [Cokeromyces recurvatus]
MKNKCPFILFTLLLLLFRISKAKRVEYEWNLVYKNINPDGLNERRIISINDQWPPEPILLNVNDTLVLSVYNKLNEPTSIHAHGLFQNNGTNIYDGAGMVTQCPIPPNHNFTYEFPVTQAGTFWIHSHFKVQYLDGLRLPLIVYDPNEPFEYDEDKIITVSDWYHENSYTNLEKYLNRENIKGSAPVPQSGLINDHVNSTITFKPGRTYRLRLINMSGIASFGISIDDHDMTVIEVDGVLTKPTLTKTVYMAAGQRISILVHTKDTTDFNYRFHARIAPAMFVEYPKGLQLNIEAPIYYNHQSPFAPRDGPKKGNYDDAYIFPLNEEPPLTPVDRQVKYTVDFVTDDRDGIKYGVMNGISYSPPLVPTLNTLLTMENDDLANNPLVYGGPETQVTIFELNQVIELVIENLDIVPHPFHLHGHVFQVIARNKGRYNNQTTVKIPDNPTYRDTIGVPSQGYVVLRFRTNNPGVWFFHCHVDWHVPAGLALTFITAPSEARKRMMPLPQPLIDICHASGLPAEGNAEGKQGLVLKESRHYSGFIMAALIATLVGFSTIIWHVWVDPSHAEEEEEEEEREARKPLLSVTN